MEQLRSLGHTVGEYVGNGKGDTVLEDCVGEGGNDTEEEDSEYADPDLDVEGVEGHSGEDSCEDTHPLLFFYDCEATGFSIYDDHLTEIAAKVVGVPLSCVTNPSFSSLVHTPRNIPKKGKSVVI